MSIKYNYLNFFFIFLIFCTKLKSIELILSNGHEIRYELIDKNFQKDFILKELKFTSDINFQKNEFLYLTNLKVGTLITVKDVKNACFYLKQKNKFDAISLFVEDEKDGKKLHFKLNAFYTFSKLKVQGILSGKEIFRQLYLLEPGERFDIAKHKKSIKNIKYQLKKDGYFNSNIESFFVYEATDKSVKVKININKGKVFSINKINFEFKKNYLNNKEFNLLKKKIYKLFFNKFIRIKYSSKFLKNKKKIIENYFKKNNFPFFKIKFEKIINLKSNNIDLNIILELNQKKILNFFGNKHLSNLQLNEFILSKDDNFINMPIEILAQELVQLYKQKGFWKIKIDAHQKDSNYFFNINEGKRALIDKIRFSGNKFFSNKVITNLFFKEILKSKFVINEEIEKAIERLISYYLKFGFWDIKINKQIDEIHDSNKYIINLNFIENEQKFLKSVSLKNFKNVGNELFANYQNLKKSIPFDIKILEEQHMIIHDYFNKKGYQNINISYEIKSKNNENFLLWKIKFKEDILKFGKFIIQGNNKKISFDRIVREVNFAENDIWKKDKIEKSYFNLNDSKIFESVQIYPTNYTDFNGNKPTIIKLFADDPFEFRARLGVQQVNYNFTTFKGIGTYRVGGSFIYKNPFGIFDQFKIDADFSSVQKNLITEYRLPWIFGIPIKTLIKFYWNKYYQPLFIGSYKNIYQSSNVGFLASCTKSIDIKHKSYNRMSISDGKINFGFNFGIETLKIYGLSIELSQAIDFSTNLIDKRIPYFFIEPNCIIDFLDDKFTPKNGFLTVASFKGMFSFEDSRDYFLRFLLEQSFFYNIIHNSVLALRIRFGHIFAEPFNRLMPTVRFYLGGPNSIRSYQPDFAPPLGCYTDVDNTKQFVPQGGKTMLNANLELRMPFFKELDLVLFQDFGFLYNDKRNLKFENLLSATGFGFRYNTPIGPLRFDIGWCPENNKNKSSFAWFLTLGQAF